MAAYKPDEEILWSAGLRGLCERGTGDYSFDPHSASEPLRSAKQGRSCPKNRRLSVKVSGPPLSIEIILPVVLLPGSLAHIGHVVVLIDVSGYSDPSLARARRVRFCVQPAVLYARNHGKAEHGGA
jgi:hypothetical protein